MLGYVLWHYYRVSVNGYVSLTGFTSFAPIWGVAYKCARINYELCRRSKQSIAYRWLRRVQIPMDALSTHCRSQHDCRTPKRTTSWCQQLRLHTSKPHIEAWILQAQISIISSFNWAPWWQWKMMQRLTPARDASLAATTVITTTHRDYLTWPMRRTEYDRGKSNTIPTSQLSGIICRRTYNQWSYLTSELALWTTEGKVKRVSASCIPTTLASSKKLGGQQQQRKAGESQKGGDKKRNFRPSISEPAENNSGNSNHSKNPDSVNSKSVKSNKHSGGSPAYSSPGPWLSKEVYTGRKGSWQCTRSGSGDHKTYLCTKYPQHYAVNQSTNRLPCNERLLSPSLHRKLELPYEPVFTSTLAQRWCM